MPKGTVKWYSDFKHYGFLESEGKDFFFHGSEVSSSRTLRKGDPVTFEVDKSDKGPKGVKVTLKEEN